MKNTKVGPLSKTIQKPKKKKLNLILTSGSQTVRFRFVLQI